MGFRRQDLDDVQQQVSIALLQFNFDEARSNGASERTTTTIHKRIQFARQFMHAAVDWKIIDENPFCKVKTQKSSVKVMHG